MNKRVDDLERIRRQVLREGRAPSAQAFFEGYSFGLAPPPFTPLPMRAPDTLTARARIERAWAEVGAYLRAAMKHTST